MTIEFRAAFEGLTGHRPFGWQERLFRDFLAGHRYDACDIPTGLGKTSIIPIWLIALATQAEAAPDQPGQVTLPRRLVYVVNRRTVVDQATDDAMAIRAALSKRENPAAAAVGDALSRLCVDPEDVASPLAISTLRGELADNREWQADPARAAIVVGTVDMIGSRLLFSGYGDGRWHRALSAGLLGQDVLLVHDEAHLSAPFGALVKAIAKFQYDAGEPRPLRVMEMSATPSPGREKSRNAREPFALEDDEKADPTVAKRLDARKSLRIASVADGDALRQKLVETALAHAEPEHGALRVLVYCHMVDDAEAVFGAIEKKVGSERVKLLVGPLRGYERDQLAESRVFRAFKASSHLRPDQTVFLVATSAGEVGVDLDADHMVCDLTTLDSMIQRLGRVNRLGRDGDGVAKIDVFLAPPGKSDDAAREARRDATAAALQRLALRDGGGHDASPRTLRKLMDDMQADGSLAAAFAPSPRIVPVTDILLDNWALTSVRDLPGRPQVQDWLHGKAAEPPETTVVWREEAEAIAAALNGKTLDADDVNDWFDAHRIEPQERLRVPTHRAVKSIEAMARRTKKDERQFYALALRGDRVEPISIDALADQDRIANATVILPVGAGGLTDGRLDGGSAQASDVADMARAIGKWDGAARASGRRWRACIGRDEGVWTVKAVGDVDKEVADRIALFNAELPSERSLEPLIRRLARKINAGARPERRYVEEGRARLTPDDDPDAAFRMLVSFAPARAAETVLDRTEAAPAKRTLPDHLDDAERYAKRFAASLGLPLNLAGALARAAGGHDWGKNRRPWQRAIGNADLEHPLAKSDHRRFDRDMCKGYRHEFGSLIDAMDNQDITGHVERDLILHLIASHHGWARPHFRDQDDFKTNGDKIAEALAETPRRYARLQRRFGRWGLAWLEALMKAADVMATTHIEPEEDKP